MNEIIGGTYIVGDIHGMYEYWMKMKKKIEQEDPEAKFILVGDIEDRGPDSYKMILWAMENIAENGKYQMVKGNHEDLKVKWWKTLNNYFKNNNIDIKKEGYASGYVCENYGFDKYMDANDVTVEEMEKIINWMDSLPLYKYIDVNNKKFIISHANFPSAAFDKNGEIDTMVLQTLYNHILWDRHPGDFKYNKNIILVNGHTPTIFDEAFPGFPFDFKNNYGKILKQKNRFNIDCGIAYERNDGNANLAILRLDDFKEYYLK